MNKTTRKIIFSVLITILVIAAGGAAGFIFGVKPVMDSMSKQINTYKSTIGMSMHTVYVASHDLNAGDTLHEEDIYEKETYITNVSDTITMDDVGKTLLVTIPAEEVIYRREVIGGRPDDTERRVEYACFAVSEGMNPGTYIDVRIRFQNGEDYCVLSRKMISEIDLEKSVCYLTVDKDEIRRMASAIVDAKIYNAHMYSTAYTYGNIQPASEVTYLPSYSDPEFRREYFSEEMITARDDMINRLVEYANTAMQYDIGLDISDQAKTSGTNGGETKKK